MADPKSYREILEDQKMIEELIDLPNTDEEERESLQIFGRILKAEKPTNLMPSSRSSVNVITVLNNSLSELDELKESVSYWKNKRQNVINIIKAAYQNQLISSKPTGIKYQATIRNVLPKVQENFSDWSENEKQKFGIKKTLTVETIRDGEVIKKHEDVYADKEELRQTLMQNPNQAPRGGPACQESLTFVWLS